MDRPFVFIKKPFFIVFHKLTLLIFTINSGHHVNCSIHSIYLLLTKKFVKLIICECNFVHDISPADLVMVISITANQKTARGSGGKTSDEASRGKNKFFLAKWFGFGSK